MRANLAARLTQEVACYGGMTNRIFLVYSKNNENLLVFAVFSALHLPHVLPFWCDLKFYMKIFFLPVLLFSFELSK